MGGSKGHPQPGPRSVHPRPHPQVVPQAPPSEGGDTRGLGDLRRLHGVPRVGRAGAKAQRCRGAGQVGDTRQLAHQDWGALSDVPRRLRLQVTCPGSAVQDVLPGLGRGS